MPCMAVVRAVDDDELDTTTPPVTSSRASEVMLGRSEGAWDMPRGTAPVVPRRGALDRPSPRQSAGRAVPAGSRLQGVRNVVVSAPACALRACDLNATPVLIAVTVVVASGITLMKNARPSAIVAVVPVG